MKWWQPIVYVHIPMMVWSVVVFVVLAFFKRDEISMSQAILLALFTIVYLFGYVFSWRMYCDARDAQEREDRVILFKEMNKGKKKKDDN